MSEKTKNMTGMGWLPDYPSFKDYTLTHDEVSPRLKRFGQKDSVKTMLKKVGQRSRRRSFLLPQT